MCTMPNFISFERIHNANVEYSRKNKFYQNAWNAHIQWLKRAT